MLFHADSEDSDQTGPMPRLTRVFTGGTGHFVGFVMRRLIYFTPAHVRFAKVSPSCWIIEYNVETLCGKGLLFLLNFSDRQLFTFVPPHDKTNKMACAPSEDSDQPGHSPSVIRVFTVLMKKPWVLSYPLRAQQRL